MGLADNGFFFFFFLGEREREREDRVKKNQHWITNIPSGMAEQLINQNWLKSWPIILVLGTVIIHDDATKKSTE